ncbi:RNA recognition domain-containing protein [Colletotrichum plurivorum]|uniref:RNA recognition domain-containing protein n=1 Tax=Colletotrichum plurivorum TaxID=2175906 RepID=A0A8H6U4G4_9PEZI|nr:RNA recognition domain-containing protein [Colletotrichum plurivorum]
MSSSSENKVLLERLRQLSLQHQAEVAARAGSAASLNMETSIDRQASSSVPRTTPDFSSISSEGPEHDGGVRLNASSLRGSPASFARRSEAYGKSLRPTSSATATVGGQNIPVQDEDDVFTSNEENSANVVASSSSYTLNQSHIQQADVKGKGRATEDTYVGGSPVKAPVMTYDPTDPQATYPSTACIFVANLPEQSPDWTLEAAVSNEFARFGVVFVKIRRDSQGMPFAFVQFTNDDNAKAARIQGKGSMILGRPCRTETVRANRTYIIYRRNRSAISMEEANELLAPFGELETIRFLDQEIQDQMRLPVTVRVQFRLFDPTQQVLRAFRLNKTYKVEAYDFKKAMQVRARNPERQTQDFLERDRRSIFMGDLPLDFTEEDIRTLMEDVGGVVSVQLKRLDYNNRDGPKLIAFVEFTNPTVPAIAIERYNLNSIGGSIIRVEHRTDRRRRDNNHTPAHLQGNNGYTGYANPSIGGRPPSTPAHEQQHGPLAIEAGPSTFAPEAVRGTPVRNESVTPMGQHNLQGNNVVPAHQNQQGMQNQQNVGPAYSNQVPTHIPIQVIPNQVPGVMHPQIPAHHQGPVHHHGVVHQTPVHHQGPVNHQTPVHHRGQVHHQTPVHQGPIQYPMAPPPMPTPMAPQQMGPPMMPHPPATMGPNMGFSPYMATPHSQGPYSQGPGSGIGFITPQQSPAHFWGYGAGTPLWTPFPIDPAAFMAYTSPAPHHPGSNMGMSQPASIQPQPNQITQSEPVNMDNAQAQANQAENKQQ